MSRSSQSVDNAEAQRTLNREWNRVLNDDEHDYLDDSKAAQKIHEVLNGSQLTYKYILVTNVIAKAVNPDIHYRAMQAQWDHPGAYNARSLGHAVLVEWEKAHGERLGGSNEPFLNKPARYPSFSMENSYRSEDAHARLYDLLERLEAKTESGEIDPKDILRHTLYEISQLSPNTIDYDPPASDLPYADLHQQVSQYIESSGGGERLASVTAGVMKAYYGHTDGGEWNIEAENANVPDEFSNAAGDVEVFSEDELVRAIEVKDKPAERSDIQHAITKARQNELSEYLFVVGQGWRNDDEHHAALAEIDDTNVELILVDPADLLGILKFVEGAGRRQFVEAVGEFLNEMRADEVNKEDWEDVVNSV